MWKRLTSADLNTLPASRIATPREAKIHSSAAMTGLGLEVGLNAQPARRIRSWPSKRNWLPDKGEGGWR